MKIIAMVFLFGLSVMTQSSFADAQRFTIVGRGLIFALAEPAGWKMDTESGKRDGVSVVYYQPSQSWDSAPVVMYANTAVKACQPSLSLEDLIKHEVQEFINKNPNLKVSDSETLDADGRKFVIKQFTGDRYGNHEAVAYMEEQDVYVSVTLSANTLQQFEIAYAAFKELIASYQYVSSVSGCAQ
jgi:hypothetical protein